MKLCKYGCGQWLDWNEALNAYVTQDTTNIHNSKTCPAHRQKGRAEQPGNPATQPPTPQTERDVLLDIRALLEEIRDRLGPMRDFYERR